MRRVLGGLVVALSLASAAMAADPLSSIEGNSTVAPKGVLVLSGLKAQSDRPIIWKQKGGPAQVIFFTLDQGDKKGVLLFAPQMPETPGRYTFKQVCIGTPAGATEPTADADVFDVVVTGTIPPTPDPVPPGPTPNPNPNPEPPAPQPTPIVSGKFWAFYVADASAKPTDLRNQTDLKDSPAILAAAPALDMVYRWAQSDTKDPEMAGWVAYAKSDKGPGLPCVFFVTPDGKEVGRKKSPTEADIVAEAKRLKGVK